MSLPRSYRDWGIDVNPDAPASMFWQATHPAFEDPDHDDGRPLVLSAETEQELWMLIDDELFNAAVEE